MLKDKIISAVFLHLYIALIAGIVFLVNKESEDRKEKEAQVFTRICADRVKAGDVICNDYPGHIYPNPNGCAEITITGAPAEICGNYTIERRTEYAKTNNN
ncbi:MAG TPA: hypothetical protein VIU13_14350 [Chryseolinea sp.]